MKAGCPHPAGLGMRRVGARGLQRGEAEGRVPSPGGIGYAPRDGGSWGLGTGDWDLTLRRVGARGLQRGEAEGRVTSPGGVGDAWELESGDWELLWA